MPDENSAGEVVGQERNHAYSVMLVHVGEHTFRVTTRTEITWVRVS